MQAAAAPARGQGPTRHTMPGLSIHQKGISRHNQALPPPHKSLLKEKTSAVQARASALPLPGAGLVPARGQVPHATPKMPCATEKSRDPARPLRPAFTREAGLGPGLGGSPVPQAAEFESHALSPSARGRRRPWKCRDTKSTHRTVAPSPGRRGLTPTNGVA